MSPDTVSLLFPDRPIRPLPKRRLRERLSPEVAGAIKYPPSTHDSIPVFYYPPYSGRIGGGTPSIEPTSPVEQGRRNGSFASLPPPPGRSGGGTVGDNEEEIALRSTLVARSPPEILGRAIRPSPRTNHCRTADPQPPPSATSSVDGYDSFENTNNKKKRKIPTAGESVVNGGHALNIEIGSLAISARTQSPTRELSGDRYQQAATKLPGHGSYASSSHDLSGSGRGRLGRSKNARSPLRTLPDGNGAWAGRPKSGQAQLSAGSGSGSSSIISNAIANAEKLPFQSQENMSLLLQHSAAGKAMPATTQFTFTCESQLPGAVRWPGNPSRHAAVSQTNPGLTSATDAHVNGNQDGSSKTGRIRSSSFRMKAHLSLEEELVGMARYRRQLAAYNYEQNPPKLEDVWVCEFCEYERIFGEPPRALIREYEMKDRRHRQEEADRKRLLEKAKAKSRKAKKAGKGAAKGGHATNPPSDQLQAEQVGDGGAPRMDAGHSHSTQSQDEYDDFADDYSNPPPARVNGIGVDHNQTSQSTSPPRAKS